MLTFKNTNLFLGLVLVALISVDFIYGIEWWYYLALCFVYSLILFYGSSFISSNFYLRVICRGSAGKQQIAITFDDGPAGNFTEGILDILALKKAPAMFFCIGKNIAGKESLLQRMAAEGHIIGNHSFSHNFWFDMYSAKRIGAELLETNETIARVLGVQPALFRPPYGVTTPNIASALETAGMTAVGWNIRSMDTVVRDDKKLLQKVTAALKPGSIVLFHDTSEATFSMLPAFIDVVHRQGYEIVSLDKLINIAPYA